VAGGLPHPVLHRLHVLGDVPHTQAASHSPSAPVSYSNDSGNS
jgi:hypothetical protein